MKKLLFLLILILNCAYGFSQAKLKGTVAVDSFKLSPVSTSSQKYIQSNYSQDIRLLGESFAALFTDKLRKAGYAVVTRKNIDTLIQENQLGQSGLVDDEGAIKLKSADYRLVGTIRQFEENEKSNTAIGVVGALAGVQVKQAQAKVEVVIELIARDGTVIASATGVGEKTGKITNTAALGGITKNRVFGVFSNSSTGFESTAMTSATSASADNAVKELSKQLKNYSEDIVGKVVTETTTYNLNGIKTVVLFPDSLVAEEVFLNALSASNAKIVQAGIPISKAILTSQDSFADYSRNLSKTNGNPKILIVGTIESEKNSVLGQNSTRISMTVKAVRLVPFEFIAQESIQNAVVDVSNKAGYDRAVKQAAQSLVAKVLNKVAASASKSKSDEPVVYSLNLTGFQSFSSAKRFVDILKKNPGITSVEMVDYSGQNLVLDVKANGLESLLEQDKNLSEFFTVSISSVNDGKVIGSVIIR